MSVIRQVVMDISSDELTVLIRSTHSSLQRVTQRTRMKLIITLTLLAVSHARVVTTGCDDVVSINNINYEKEVLKDNVELPNQMAIDYDTNTLFFSYTANTADDVFISAALDLKTNQHRTIPGIDGGFAATVDRKNHKVYLGGRDGIYEYDYTTQRAVHVNTNGYSIWQMFAKDTLYYTAYPQERLYTFQDNKSVIIPELKRTMVLLVALDNNNDIYFSNSSGLFYFTQSDKEITQLGEYAINSFTADINGNLYFSTQSGFYNIDSEQNVNQLAQVNDISGVVVEADKNFIYGSGDQIIRLKQTKKQCF